MLRSHLNVRQLRIGAVQPMTITIELPPEVEASLAAPAAERGLALPDYLHHLLEEQVAPRKAPPLSPGDRARLWRESAKGTLAVRWCGRRESNPPWGYPQRIFSPLMCSVNA